MLLDLRRQRTHLRKFDAIVVTGDIAYAGKRAEFEIASKWLDALREQLDTREENILVTPGNHDVDRDTVSASTQILELHAKLRGCTNTTLQSIFSNMMSNDEGHLLFDAITEFNSFARRYGCVVHRDEPFWERNFKLSERVILRIRGMTSICVSGVHDDDRANRMILGEIQCALQQESGVEYLTMAHHPPSWLLDQDDAQRYLNARARIQLYGHKHEQWIEPAGRGVRVVAGAVHPERTESNWIPRYNVLTLSVRRENNTRFLEVRVYPRRWSNEETCFIADCGSNLLPIRSYSFRLDEFPMVSEAPAGGDVTITVNEEKLRLRYRLEMLSKDLQIRIAEQLDLRSPNHLQIDAPEFAELLIRTVEEQERLDKLFDLVEEYHGVVNQRENPFRKSP